MRRRATEDIPSYATDAAASAQLSSSYLAVSGGLLLALLAVISVVEAPIPPGTGSIVKAWMREARREPAAAGATSVPPACAGTQILTSHPAGEAPARAG